MMWDVNGICWCTDQVNFWASEDLHIDRAKETHNSAQPPNSSGWESIIVLQSLAAAYDVQTKSLNNVPTNEQGHHWLSTTQEVN